MSPLVYIVHLNGKFSLIPLRPNKYVGKSIRQISISIDTYSFRSDHIFVLKLLRRNNKYPFNKKNKENIGHYLSSS